MKQNRLSRAIAPLSAFCMGFALAGCDKTPPASEYKHPDGTTYTLMKSQVSSAPPVYLHGQFKNASTSYMFDKTKGYTAIRYETYLVIGELMIRRSSVTSKNTTTAEPGSKDYADKLEIGCKLAKQMIEAPKSMNDIKPERLEKDRVLGTTFSGLYCKP